MRLPDIKKWLIDSGVDVRQQTTKYNHTFTSFAESMNKHLASRLFAAQDLEELKTLSSSTVWVKNMYAMVDKMNNEVTEMTELKPVDAIKLDKVELIKKFKHYEKYDKKVHDFDEIYRYLLKPGEEHGDARRRETNNI